jgi:hypothetical protein
VCVSICTYVYVYVYIYIFISIYIDICIYVYFYTYIHTFTYIYLHTCIYIHTYVHLYVHIYRFQLPPPNLSLLDLEIFHLAGIKYWNDYQHGLKLGFLFFPGISGKITMLAQNLSSYSSRWLIYVT